jgi:four helix bundle protein
MATVHRFEDLVAWQKARQMTRHVYQATRNTNFARDFGLSSQIQRAAVSTMSNIAEGFDRGRRREFHQFLSTAKASCAEVRSLLHIASDIGYLTQPEFDALLAQSEEVSRIIGGLRAAVARQLPPNQRGKFAGELRSNATQPSALSPQSPSPS